MAKSELRLKARQLRKAEGKSIIEIASILGVAKSTVSLWCNDIRLTDAQIQNLISSKERALKKAQIIAAINKRERWLKKVEGYKQYGIKKLRNLSQKEYFIAGLSLYLAEGSKTHKKVVFTNSDPKLIRFMKNWLADFFSISEEDFKYYVIINIIHKDRENLVKDFWSKYLNIKATQFGKVSYVISKQKKVYENYNFYYGTMHMQVLKGADLSCRIKGLIEGLLSSDIFTSRRSLMVEAPPS